MNRARLARALLLALAAGLFVWALSRVPLRDAWATIRKLDAVSLGVLVGVNLVALLAFGAKWWIVLRGLGHRIGIWHTSLYRLAGFSVSYFTPGPRVGGEPAQVLPLERRHAVSREVAVASVVLDRLIDAVVNFGFLAGAALLLLGGRGLAFPAVLVLVPSGYLLALARGHHPVARLIRRPVVEEAEARAGRFCRERGGHFVLASLAAVLAWAVGLAEYGLLAFFLGTRMSFEDLVVGVAAARLAYYTFVPAALGVLEAGQVVALRALGLPEALGLSLSLVIRLRDVLVASLGLWLGMRWLLTSPRREGGEERLDGGHGGLP